MRKLAHSEQRGFLTIAQNGEVDYLRLAYMQAMSIKLTMPDSKYAVIVDADTNKLIQDKHRKVFDYIILLEQDYAVKENWKLSNEWQTYYLTPFKETIKIESDLIFTRSIDHWWHAFRLKNIVLSQGCRDYLQNISSSRAYRKLFDDNELPDTYNGLMYFRYSQESSDFFNFARLIFNNWSWIKDNVLKNCRDEDPTTDVVYAISALVLGIENCTLPGIDFINFVHMKSLINGFSQQTAWPNLVVCEQELPMIRINNVNQYHPLHYYEKEWATEELIENYEFELGRRIL